MCCCDTYCCAKTGGELLVSPETAAAYETGHGSVVLRATAHVEYEDSKREKKRTPGSSAQDAAAAAAAAEADATAAVAGGKALIVFTEMPYQVCKVGAGRCCCGQTMRRQCAAGARVCALVLKPTPLSCCWFLLAAA